MIIELDNISKRYDEHWILKNLSYRFESGKIYGIKGSNGSGKSTLMKMIAGFLSSSVGSIKYEQNKSIIKREDIFKQCILWGPHTGLYKELSIGETIDYFLEFKDLAKGLDRSSFISALSLPLPQNTLVNTLSSGQEQRLGLGLAIMSAAPILLLDETTSYLDATSIGWFENLLNKYGSGRLVILSSNEKQDLDLTDEVLDVMRFK